MHYNVVYRSIEQTELMKPSQEEGQAFDLFDIVDYSLLNTWIFLEIN